jgi:hypothetical protein
MLTLSRQVQIAFYTAETVVIGTARQPALHVRFLETCLNTIEHCLREWKVASNAHKSTAELFVKPKESVQKPQRVQIMEESMQWVDIT